MIDREVHTQEAIERLLQTLPRYSTENKRAVMISVDKEMDFNKQLDGKNQEKGAECAICLEECIAAEIKDEHALRPSALIMQCGVKSVK